MSPEEFANEFGHEFIEQTTPDYGPYGQAAHPVKPGLTKRGKVAITVATMAVAGTGFFWYQSHSAQVAHDTIRAQELQYKQDLIELEKLKEINKATTAQKKEQATEDAARQKFVNACVDADKSLIGKQMGVKYSSVVADCQAQYQGDEGSVDGADMAAASSTADTGSRGGGGINSTGLLAMVASGGVLVVYAANRTKKRHTA